MPWPPPEQAQRDPTPPTHAGLGDKDRRIWNEHLRKQTIVPVRVWWNQVVGSLPEWAQDVQSPTLRAWVEATYRKRPDVVIDNGQTLWVCELKPFASYIALGQALMYSILAAAMPEPIAPIVPAILTDDPDPDLLHVAPNFPALVIISLGQLLEPRPTFPT